MRFTSSWPHETVLPTRNAECLPTRDRRFVLAHPRIHHPARGADPGRGSQLMPCLSTLTPVRLETIPQKIQLMRGIPVERDMPEKIGRSEKFRAGTELREAGNHRVSRTRATIAAYWQASSRMRVKSPVAIVLGSTSAPPTRPQAAGAGLEESLGRGQVDGIGHGKGDLRGRNTTLRQGLDNLHQRALDSERTTATMPPSRILLRVVSRLIAVSRRMCECAPVLTRP